MKKILLFSIAFAALTACNSFQPGDSVYLKSPTIASQYIDVDFFHFLHDSYFNKKDSLDLKYLFEDHKLLVIEPWMEGTISKVIDDTTFVVQFNGVQSFEVTKSKIVKSRLVSDTSIVTDYKSLIEFTDDFGSYYICDIDTLKEKPSAKSVCQYGKWNDGSPRIMELEFKSYVEVLKVEGEWAYIRGTDIAGEKGYSCGWIKKSSIDMLSKYRMPQYRENRDYKILRQDYNKKAVSIWIKKSKPTVRDIYYYSEFFKKKYPGYRIDLFSAEDCLNELDKVNKGIGNPKYVESNWLYMKISRSESLYPGKL